MAVKHTVHEAGRVHAHSRGESQKLASSQLELDAGNNNQGESKTSSDRVLQSLGSTGLFDPAEVGEPAVNKDNVEPGQSSHVVQVPRAEGAQERKSGQAHAQAHSNIIIGDL